MPRKIKGIALPQEVLPTLTPPIEPAPTAHVPAVLSSQPARPGLTPLAEMAANINAEFTAVDTAENSALNHRIAAGRMLKEVRDRLLASSMTPDKPNTISFESWFKRNIKRSKSDIYACIKLVSSSDPTAAHEAEKKRARDGMAKHNQSTPGQRKPRTAPSVNLQTVPSTPMPAMPAMPPAIEPVTVAWETAPITADMLYAALTDLGKSIGDAMASLTKDKTNLPTALSASLAATRTFLMRVEPKSDKGE